MHLAFIMYMYVLKRNRLHPAKGLQARAQQSLGNRAGVAELLTLGATTGRALSTSAPGVPIAIYMKQE